VPRDELMAHSVGEASDAVRARVEGARTRQIERQGKCNSELSARELDRYCKLDAAGESLLKQAIARLNLSARAYHRVLKLARSIADMTQTANIAATHVAEAIQYRRFDRAG